MTLRPALKRSVNRARQGQLPANPQTLADLRELPQEFQFTSRGDLPMFDSYEDGDGDDVEDEQRIIIFATRENLMELGRSTTWFCDGTSQVCPFLFTQLFTIHGRHHNVAFPLLYALLPNKEERSYTKVFEAIK